ncbi:NK-tumor recognition protein isoform X1 [Fundulus heteroclitus]|uniref:NK-tumor recognition protein isoform X1 n=3 Tax=Fundulus heteroclitus TaxID=8078 RepID=UPI00165AF8FE|nr:NK-tumor recognition protein isoform X1 [Fundulus heteroclitus]XP_021163046.2 NK-tumor recognition protein isoform X1 [Fundulus heteroclitus]
MGVKDRPQCYFDVELNREPVGRIVFQLFSDVCPKTSKNFLCLCTGEKGTGKVTGKKLCYKGSTFHRVVKKFMIQGGDFTEGNGRGGESIYGGYFEDENFILKHDRAFLLSMANRGKNTNGSQFFITTKMAPHLDGVHVVFGLVISGFEVIKKIEKLKTDSASRPYADVRVVDCGQLITKSANDVLEGKRKRTSSLNSNDSFRFSLSESESEEKLNYQKQLTKGKQSKKKRKEGKKVKKTETVPSKQRSVEKEMAEGESKPEEEKESGGKREKLVVRPEEIPPVPENRFLLRRDMPAQEDKAEAVEKEESGPSADQKPAVTKSGRKIRGRGTIRYHTPTRSKSRSTSVEEREGSETPPHWKVETKRTKVFPPLSPERWSKGDKLKERSSSKWDNRSDSPRSQSGERSSDQSSERSSQRRLPNKEKKRAKHKKKAKKRKHGKKKSSKNKSREQHESEGEKSASSARRSRSRTPSRSTSSEHPPSSKRRRRSSPSFSKSYSRSYTSSRSRSQGKSRSYSRSRSFSRSGSRSFSRSGSLSYSQSRSRSRSRYRSRSRSFSQSRSRSRSRYTSRSRSLSSRKRSLSRSPRKRKTTKAKPDVMIPAPGKVQDKKITAVPILPAVRVTERVPVIPLSDSPPPSRWKPDQKPWKPSYFHIQEIKAKVAASKPSTTAPAADSFSEKAKTSVTAKAAAEDVPDKAALKTTHSPRSRSSRSKSFSRSRSPSSSRSPSRSAEPYRSRSSSSNGSISEKEQTGGSNKRNSLDREWKEYYSSLNRIKNLDKYITVHKSGDGLSGSEKEMSGERSPAVGVSVENKRDNSEETKRNVPLPVESFNSRSEWDSDSDKVSQSNAATEKQAAQCGTTLSAGWNSDGEPETVTSKRAAGSEKEEGEASSESDYEALKNTSIAATELANKAAAASSSCPSDDGAQRELERKKSKKKAKRKRKHKRKGEGKTSSHHGKDKAKKSKRKHQKLKETFHWQPPLEFDEEEEEDDAKRERRSPGRELAAHPGDDLSKKDQNSTDLKKRPAVEEETELRSKESYVENKSPSEQAAHGNSAKNQDSLDDMEICTPEHNVEIIEHPVTPDLPSAAAKLTPGSALKPAQAASTDGVLPQSRAQPEITAAAAAAQGEEPPGRAAINFKWKPLKRMTAVPEVTVQAVVEKSKPANESAQRLAAQGVKMEIKSKNRVRPGSLFDEVRKTVRLNQRPRNQESSSDESSPSAGKARGASRSPKKSSSLSRKSRSGSSHRSRSRGWSRSSSRSRSRSRSYSYSSRSRSRSRRTRRRGRSRSRSSTYRSYSRHSRSYSRSPSRSRSHHRHRRSRSDSYDSYSSRSVSRRRGRRRSESYRSSEHRSRSSRSSSRSSSRHRSRSSRYS